MAVVMHSKPKNSFAEAWFNAAEDLGIEVKHPFEFVNSAGVKGITCGVFLPDFGSENGTLLTCRFDTEEIFDLTEETEYFESGLNPHSYEPYTKVCYIETLNDWGWFNKNKEPPEWFSGKLGSHGA